MTQKGSEVPKNKMALDMILNITAAAIPVALLQIVIYPLISRHILEEEYGLMITLYSLWALISNTLGNVIFNIRLINDSNYLEHNYQGDFLRIVILYGIVNTVIISAITIYYNQGVDHLLLSIVTANLLFLKSYLDVGFRLKIDFLAVTISAVLVGVGFFIGTLIAIKTGVWEMIFITGYASGTFFAAVKSKLLKEGIVKTPLYSRTFNDCLKLTGASIIANSMTYADKLVLFPLMGGRTTAIYYNATILAKIVGMVTGPASGVILTYLSKKKNASKNLFRKMLLSGFCIVTVAYFLVIMTSRPVFLLLYPQWVEDIMIYIPVTTANECILALISLINPYVMKFCDLKWQLIINSVGVAVYFAAATVLWSRFGLMGFCFGTVIGSSTRLALIFYAYCFKSNLEVNSNQESYRQGGK